MLSSSHWLWAVRFGMHCGTVGLWCWYSSIPSTCCCKASIALFQKWEGKHYPLVDRQGKGTEIKRHRKGSKNESWGQSGITGIVGTVYLIRNFMVYDFNNYQGVEPKQTNHNYICICISERRHFQVFLVECLWYETINSIKIIPIK